MERMEHSQFLRGYLEFPYILAKNQLLKLKTNLYSVNYRSVQLNIEKADHKYLRSN